MNKNQKNILVVIVLLGVIAIFAGYSLPKMATIPATTIYQYTWESSFTVNSQEKQFGTSHDAVKADIKQGLEKAYLEKFAEKFAELGRWYRVDSVDANIEYFDYMLSLYDLTYFEAKGTVTMVFLTDATPDQEFSPQGWEEILGFIIGAIYTIIMASPHLFFILLIIIALTILALAGGFKSVLFGTNPFLDPLGNLNTILIIGFIGIAVLLLLGKMPKIKIGKFSLGGK